MSDGESVAKYFPDVCPECQQEYEWITVLESPRRGEEPDYMFVHDSEIEGPFTRITESCRVCEHVADPEWDSSGCSDRDGHRKSL